MPELLAQANGGSGVGLNINDQDIMAILALGRTATKGEAVNITTNSIFGVTTTSAGTGGNLQTPYGIWGIVVDDEVADGEQGRVRVKGIVDAILVSSTSATDDTGIGTPLVVVQYTAGGTGSFRLDTKGFAGTGTTTRKIMGVTLESGTSSAATSSGTTYALTTILFDGINGFGGANGA